MAIPPRRRANLRIPYQSEGFPAGSIPNTSSDLVASWDQLLWAAMTLGRPNLHSVFQHGEASYHEAIFRLSAVRLAVEQHATTGWRLYRTDAFKRLDPTEKGAVSYFLGMTFCSLFAAKLLDTPWQLHLDVFQTQLNANTQLGRSRPDLVGQATTSGAWHAFECKGRSSPPNSQDKAKAKRQAQRLISVGGSPCDLHIGTFTYFKNDRLEFYWRDPPPKGEQIKLPDPSDLWRFHYEPALELLKRFAGDLGKGEELVEIEGLDLQVGIHPYVSEALLKEDWARAHVQARQYRNTFLEEGYEPDGIAVRAGESWLRRFRPLERPALEI